MAKDGESSEASIALREGVGSVDGLQLSPDVLSAEPTICSTSAGISVAALAVMVVCTIIAIRSNRNSRNCRSYVHLCRNAETKTCLNQSSPQTPKS
mmetsp:Transcript_23674/g.52417  ORF Transcript_23674/g.52417 Transcript_23674/m.52417 type:complete len:96 (+) Transcript_23674:756-1043(+)